MDEAKPQSARFAGAIVENRKTTASEPRPVRNGAARTGREIVALRYWKIKKGKYEEFYKASKEGVWPYFEKIGARIIGQWKVVHPEEAPGSGEDSPDYDEVYMVTRYASIEHWSATRDMAKLGGNGPDWEKCREALAFRGTLTMGSYVTVLEGTMAPSGPG